MTHDFVTAEQELTAVLVVHTRLVPGRDCLAFLARQLKSYRLSAEDSPKHLPAENSVSIFCP